jgi:hypothetical protein
MLCSSQDLIFNRAGPKTQLPVSVKPALFFGGKPVSHQLKADVSIRVRSAVAHQPLAARGTDSHRRGVQNPLARWDRYPKGRDYDPAFGICCRLGVRLHATGISEGPLFRPIAKGGQFGAERLTDQSVCSILKAYTERTTSILKAHVRDELTGAERASRYNRDDAP